MTSTTRKRETLGVARSEQVKRRRRAASRSSGVGQRLYVDPELIDHTRFAYRWINDTERRMLMKTKYDAWDIMTNDGGEIKEDATDLGSAVSAIVGSHPDGSAKRAFLCRKPIDWYNEDQAEKQTILDQQLEQLRRGAAKDGAPQSDYVPHAGISVSA